MLAPAELAVWPSVRPPGDGGVERMAVNEESVAKGAVIGCVGQHGSDPGWGRGHGRRAMVQHVTARGDDHVAPIEARHRMLEPARHGVPSWAFEVSGPVAPDYGLG